MHAYTRSAARGCLAALLFFGALVAFAASSPATRILTLTGTVHPKAEVQRVDPANGVLVFRWLDANGAPVDSGGSITTFAPVAPNPSQPGEAVTYPDVADATLIAAIQTPPAPPVTVYRVLKDTIVQRVKAAGKLAELAALVAQLPADKRFEFDQSTWFSSNNADLMGGCAALGLAPAVVLAPDPLAP